MRATITDYPPLGVADEYSTGQDSLLVSPPHGGVLDNDTDPEGDPLVAGPGYGALALSLAGTFADTPTTGFAGVDTLTYVANDSLLDSVPTTVTITVVRSQYSVYLLVVRRVPQI